MIYEIIKKVNVFFILTVVLSLISACGNQTQEDQVEGIEENIYTEESPENRIDSRPTGEKEAIVSYEVSNEETVIRYEGEYFRKSVFCAGGDMVYICGVKPSDNSYFIAGMQAEEKQFCELPVKIPDGMRVIRMTVDYLGKCHILLMSVEKVIIENEELDQITYEESFIWTIDKEGNIEKILNVSEIFAEERSRPFCFTTDNAGNYYFENKKDIIKVDSKGNVDMRLSSTGEIEAIGCGRSGDIYCIYFNEEGIDTLDILKEDGLAGYGITLPYIGPRYSSIAAGTDTELLIFNIEGGVYTYERDENVVEQRISENNMPVSGENAASHGFLGDGRLCLMTHDYEGEIITFYYISAGR